MSGQVDLVALQAEVKRLRLKVDALEKSNKELLTNKQQLDAILNNAPVEIYLKDREGRYLRINKEFEKIFGVLNEDLVGLLPEDVHDSELATSTRNHDLFVLASGSVERREEQAKLVSDQQLHTLLTIKFPVFAEDGEIDGLGAIVTDITDRRQAEETIRRVQKMQAMGELTGGIAHDFNNILGIVMGNIELIRILAPDDEKLLSYIDAAYKGAGRGAEITKKLLRFSRASTKSASPVSLSSFLDVMESLIDRTLPLAIRKTWQRDQSPWAVTVDLGELEDAFINIALNAMDAMPSGGQLEFKTTNLSIDEENYKSHPYISSGDYVLITIRDTGMGMTPEVLKRATEPFFTTKSASKGTGLGLSIVYAFVNRSGGHIDIQSEAGSGTRIGIYFPRASAAIKVKKTEVKQPGLPRGDETILIVDDEPALIAVAVSHLQDLGYKTVSANNSRHALTTLRANPAIDLLFADVIMPGSMNGYKLAVVAQQTFPQLKALITSGFTHRYDELNTDEASPRSVLIDELLAKPYNKQSLALAIRRALDDEVASP